MTRHSAGNLIFLLVFALLCGDWAEPAKARAQENAKGNISFTADNAAEIFINGESLGQTNNWKMPFTFEVDDLNLLQGVNVIGIAAWDSEGIAAMSGQFRMPDGTEFGTSNYENWLAFPADENTKKNNQTNDPYNVNQVNPLEAYKDILVIPDEWNAIDFEPSTYEGREWQMPGYVEEGKATSDQRFPWGSGTTGDPFWLWYGENTRTAGLNPNQETGPWYINNFVLFRYEFICADDFCNDEVGWGEVQNIDIVSRAWDDIKGATQASENASTFPYFEGGTLSFDGFAGGEYDSDFYLGDFSDNTIDNAGVNPELTGVLAGPGGMIFKGEGTTILSGENTYEGLTTIENGTLEITNVNGLGSDDVGTRIENGAALQLSLTGSIDSNGNYRQIVFNEPLVVDGGTIVFPGNQTPIGDSSDDLGSNIALTGPIQISENGATFETSISQTNGDGYRGARIRATVSGEGNFVKSGNGSLLIRDADFSGFSGDFIVSEGLLALGQDNVIPKASNVDIKQGSRVTMYSQTMNQSIASLTGKGEWGMFYEGQELRIGNNEASSLNDFEGKITGRGSIVKDGTNTLELSGSNRYTGSTTVESGTLRVTGSLSDSTAVTVAEGATYDVDSTDTIGSLAGAGSVDLATGITLTAGGDNSSTTVSGVISGAGGSFAKAGTGTTTFSGANTYTGATNINVGTLQVTGSLSDSTAVTVAEGATYDVDSTDTIGSIAGAGSVDLATGITLTAGGDNSSTTVSGVISGAGDFEKAGTGTTTFGGANTYTGATNINGGTLKVTGSLSNETAVTVGSGAIYDVDATDTIGSIAGSGSVELATGITLTAGGDNSSTVFSGVMSGAGDFEKAGTGTTTFGGANTYTGATNINGGTLKVTGSLSNETAVTVASGAIYMVENTDEIGSIAAEGDIFVASDQVLTAGRLKTNTTVSGIISGGGGFTKVGDGITTFAGTNLYQGETTIEDGALSLTNFSGIPQGSSTLVTGVGRLDLLSGPAGNGEFKIDSLSIKEGGRVFVSPSHPLVSKVITLDANPGRDSSSGGIITYLDARENPPLRVSESFDYKSGSLVVATPNPEDPEGVWEIIEGRVDNVDELAANTYIVVSGDQAYPFEGIGEELGFDGPALYKGYLAEGSLDLVIEEKSTDELVCDLNPDAAGCDGDEPDRPVVPPIPPIGCEGDDCQTGNELPDVDVDGVPDDLDKDDDNDGIPDEKDPDADGDGELDALPGCEVGDDLCDVISDSEGDEDEALEEEEEVAVEIIDAVLDGVEDEEIDLPMSFDYGQLARLIGSGLTPRNVDAAGRGLALHNNLLVDAVFDRQPLRQFDELLVAEELVEESVEEEEAVIEEVAPTQPLWLKGEELSDGEAAEYVEGAVADVEVADADLNGAEAVAIEVEEDAVVVEFDGVSLVDQQDDELDLAKRDGVSAWVKGFGGNSRADDSSILYNDYDLDAYGTSFGVDVALSETFQIGAFANYGDVNVQHRSGDTGGGSWNPEGWGGGLTAQYSARNFYVQGLLGASEFSGEQSRNILQIDDQFGGNTARGDKTVTSYLGALRLGAPFKTGGVVLEPQAQALWTHNCEHGFSETSGTEKNLRLKYKDRTTNFMETELGMKLSVPIRTGERGLLVPSVRAAWLADWNRENEGQAIGYKFTKKTATFDSELETQNGALIEAGLDYTIQNFNSTSVKVYARGGMELWNSDRGTTWRGSGGVTFQF